VRVLPASEAARDAALGALRRGELALFPTETVYGVGADAAHPAAVARLAAAKGRPDGKPFQWLVSDADAARRGSTGWDDRAARLARAFWPGPLTLVLPAGDGTVGWRVPAHDWLLGLLRALGGPIVASSANPAGLPPPKTCAEAVRLLGGSASLAVDGGTIAEGSPSTVAELTRDGLRVLRPGAISEEALRAAIA
jgi:L-threonylcarbamoyladenylate synthase